MCPTFSLGPSGPPGVLTSPADQAHRGGQGAAKQLNLAEEAFPTSGFPAALALPQPPAYVPAARLPPILSRHSEPVLETLACFFNCFTCAKIVLTQELGQNLWCIFLFFENSVTKSNPCRATTAWKNATIQYMLCFSFLLDQKRFLCKLA